MNKLKKGSPIRKTIHRTCKSQAEPHFFKSSRRSCISQLDSPISKTKSQAENNQLKTQDNRRYLIDNKSISFDINKTTKSSNSVSEKNTLNKDLLKNIKKSGSSIELLKDQDEIIQMQNSLISNLRKEISIIGKDHFEPQKFRENVKKVTIKESNKKEVCDFDGRTRVSSQEIEKKDAVIQILKEEMKIRDQVINELKHEFKVKDDKKDEIIQKLGTIIENKANLSELEKFKNLYEREKENSRKLAEDLEVTREENKVLVQDYERVKKSLAEYESAFNSIKPLLSKVSESKCTLSNAPSIIENLLSQNGSFTEKIKILTEKTTSLEKENSELMIKYSKSKIKVNDLKNQLGDSGNAELLDEKVRAKSFKVVELKKILTSQEKKSLKRSASINRSILESQLMVLEEELNLLKTEKRILINKEIDLSAKLKTSEKARFYYQEKSIRLKDRLNSLELQLKHIESISQDQKSQIDLSAYEGTRVKSNRATKLVNLL